MINNKSNSLKSIDYTTYYFGSPDNIQNSTRILLFYNKNIIPSLSNITEIHDNIINNSNYNESGIINFFIKSNEEDYFEITVNDQDNNISKKFNTIIYYSDVSDLPLGFTYFSRSQCFNIDENSRIKVLRIYTNFSVNNLSVDPTYKDNLLIINSLSSLQYSSETDSNLAHLPLTNTNLNGYPSIDTVRKYYLETSNLGLNYIRYTNSLHDLINDPSFILMTDCLNIVSGDQLRCHKFSIIDGVDINSYDTTYTHFFIGTFNGKLSLYEWSDNTETFGAYRVISLIEKNKFNLPKLLVEKKQVSGIDENFKIVTMAGNYIVLKHELTENWYTVNINDNNLTEISSNYGVLADSWSDTGKVHYFLRDINLKSVLETFQKDSEIYKNLLSLSLDSNLYLSIRFINKIGPWFVFKTTTNVKRVTLIYASIYGSIYFDESEEQDIIPINNKILLHQEKINDKEGYKFTFYLTREGLPVYSDKYAKTRGFGLEVNNKIQLHSNEQMDSDEYASLRHVVIDGLRRAPINSYSFPSSRKFISSYKGILFYIEEISGSQKIFYL